MDDKTRQQRRRNKELAKKDWKTNLSQYEARGLGRKGKSPDSFPIRQCDHLTGGTPITFRKKRHDGTYYLVRIIKGGLRCPRTAQFGTKCPEHTAEQRGEDN